MQINTVREQLWAWLFINGRTEKKVKHGDVWDKVGLSRQHVNKSAQALIEPIINEIVTSYEHWDFLFDEATESSVVGQSEYVLEGNNDDCADILNIRYGEGRGVVIEELDVLEADRREGESKAGASDTQGVYGYTRFGLSDDGSIKIQLFDSPTTIEDITYRYRRKDITIGVIPDRFNYVVKYFLRAEYDSRYESLARKMLTKMIAQIKPGGDSPKTIRMDPKIEAGNTRRGRQQGGS